MADRGTLFSAPMVRALLAGRKTQTRRLLSLRGYRDFTEFGQSTTPGYDWHLRRADRGWCDFRRDELPLPHAVGDRLWVRETFKAEELEPSGQDGLRYLADDTWRPIANDPNAAIEWLKLFTYGSSEKRGERRGEAVPAIHMPRWASRLWLTVTDVRVQRLQDISESDAIAEGLEPTEQDGVRFWIDPVDFEEAWQDPRLSYHSLWDSLHTDPGTRWADNPWIYALSFTVQQGNIDGANQ